MNSVENNKELKDDKEENSKKDYNNIYPKSSIDNINNMISNILPKNYINDIAGRIVNREYMSNIIGSILPKDYMNTVSKSILSQNYMSNLIDSILPKNYMSTISETILSQNYMSNLVDNILPKNYMNTIVESLNNTASIALRNIIPQNYVSNMFESITNNISNIFYTDTITNCINEIINSNINFNTILINKEIIPNTSVDIEQFNENDKENTLTNVKEIINISQKDNAEQLIYNKLNEIKNSHPLVAGALFQIFWIIVSLVIGAFFTENANNYYIQNYTVNNNFSIEKDEHLDFVDNARYVIAEKLNVRNGPSNDYDIIDTLKYGNVVKIKSKVKHWTEILYKDIENDIFIEGWVYTRYLEKFDIELLNNES